MTFDGSTGSMTLLEPGGAFWSFEPDAGLVSSFSERARRPECRRTVRAVPCGRRRAAAGAVLLGA